MEYKKIFLICLFSALIGIAVSPMVSATETIIDMNTNSPVPLGEILTISGNYEDTDVNVSVFCKFVTKHEGIIIERLTDERTFQNGDFYSQRKVEEPLYKRGSFYTIDVQCNNASADTNFTVGQRASIEHLAQQEALGLIQKGNTDALMQIGVAVLLVVLFIFFLLFFARMAFK